MACAVALAAGSVQSATASAAAKEGAGALRQRVSARNERAGAAGQKARHCPTRRVRAGAGVLRRISIHCQLRDRALARRVNQAPARIVRSPENGPILGLNGPRNLVRYRARAGFAGGDRFVVVRRSRGVRWRMAVGVEVLTAAQVPPTVCQGSSKTTNYEKPVGLTVTCTGANLAPLTIPASPGHGTLGNIQRSGNGSAQTLSATYLPDDLFVGRDAMVVEARGAGGPARGAATVEVRPWRMRALGDSATAGFGFLGNGNEISGEQLGECSPPEASNDRCSSNSNAGPGYEGPPVWSPDFGLANDVSWAAQFANDWQGGGHITAPVMFQNRAVTGSTPADWLPSGALHGQLESIVAEDPDLIAFTLGVNPLLFLILEKGEKHECIKESTTVPKLVECIEPIFESVAVRARLEAVYRELLAAPGAEVVTFQYHNAYPVLALIGELQPWQIEALIGHLNAEIAAAIGAVKAAMPAAASRLTLIEAQVDPTDTDPLKVARFNLGVPPNPAQTWPATYSCGGGFTVDGPSHQSSVTQEDLPGLFGGKFCAGEAWTIKADTGIHPNRAGYARFAKALVTNAATLDLVPKLP
jgi:lysophospholipase L1-like esterase